MALRVAYFCMASAYSVRPLNAMLAAGHDVRLLIRPIGGLATRREPILVPEKTQGRLHKLLRGSRADGDPERDPFAVVKDADVPCFRVGDASSTQMQELLRAARVDVIVVAFFNQLLHSKVLEIPRLGGLNAHPSLLPGLRGPSPLFWIFHGGQRETGVTVHRLARGEDDGDVFEQRAVPIDVDVRGEDLVAELGDVAAELTVAALASLESAAPTLVAQDHTKATRAPRPSDDDLTLDPTWAAERVYRFVRGVGRWVHLVVDVGGRRMRAVDALEFDPERDVPGEWMLTGDILVMGCRPGLVVLRVMPMSA